MTRTASAIAIVLRRIVSQAPVNRPAIFYRGSEGDASGQ
jgi:hypothetical protein